MPQTGNSVLADLTIVVDPDEYQLIKLSPKGIMAAAAIVAELADPFIALIADSDEVTLILEMEAYEEYAHRLIGHVHEASTYRLITFDLTLEPTLTGFMAILAKSLAEVNVPILPLAAYSRDHVLVQSALLDTAIAALTQLQTSARNML